MKSNLKKMAQTALYCGVALYSLNANATTIIGGLSFDDNAFADTLISSSGSFTTSGGSLASVLTDINEGTYAFSFSPNAYVQLGFTDNYIVNGAGNDLAVFELGVPDTLQSSLTLGGTTLTAASTSTGFSAGGFGLNVALFDLSDFGLSLGALASDIFIGLSIPSPNGTVPSLSLVGALNSAPHNTTAPETVPEPASLALLGAGFAGITILRRRKGQRKAL